MIWDRPTDLKCSELVIYPDSSILSEFRKVLMNHYSKEDIEKLLYKNRKEILIRLEERNI